MLRYGIITAAALCAVKAQTGGILSMNVDTDLRCSVQYRRAVDNQSPAAAMHSKRWHVSDKLQMPTIVERLLLLL